MSTSVINIGGQRVGVQVIPPAPVAVVAGGSGGSTNCAPSAATLGHVETKVSVMS